RRLAEGRDTTATAEPLAAAAVRARDIAWRLERDALENVKRVELLVGDEPANASEKLVFELWRLNLIFNQLERLEVRGRDSGGLAALVHLSEADHRELEASIERESLSLELARRRALRDWKDGAILVSQGALGRAIAFTHKIAREVGELGANVRELRARARRDRIFRLALSVSRGRVQVFAHTRWASNGVINEANCHPLSNEVEGGIASAPLAGEARLLPRVVLGALNGDIDNYPALAAAHARATGRPIPATITTDAKMIPVEIDRRSDPKAPVETRFRQAFAEALRSFEGSTAIAALSSDAPGDYGLALRGSGQALYLGLLPRGGYVFASELYGVVELAHRYYKLNGESERVAGDPRTRGEMVFLRESIGGASLAGLQALRYDGAALSLDEKKDVKVAQITTRDIDRAGFEHYLLKEITESPRSVTKTLRGKFVIDSSESARFLVGDRGHGARARRSRARGREPPELRPRGQEPRRPLHVGRPRRRDERRFHEGFLLPGHGRLRPRARPRERGRPRGLHEERDGRALPPRAARPSAPHGGGPRRDTRPRASRGPARSLAPALGARGLGPSPPRRRRGEDQALRALLQVDRRGHDRGQEAHRPLLRAARARVRRGPLGSGGRGRRQGGRDLPRAPCGARRGL
ncbi:hypothetical protein HY251_01460, partial [bacterium]|nr:hypothetical protein [bacterium]